MTNKFTIEDLLIRIMPGGFFLAILFLIYGSNIQLNLVDDLDFLYTFLFFCSAFIVGELLQTLAHELEFVVDIFFKFRRPSEIFLYKENPVTKNEYTRKNLIRHLNLSKDEVKIFKKSYNELSAWKKNKDNDKLSQNYFWKIYSQVSNSDEMKISNINYLFIRVITIEFLLISGILFFVEKNIYCGIISFIIFLIFLWRSRGLARGLVFKTILLNLKK